MVNTSQMLLRNEYVSLAYFRSSYRYDSLEYIQSSTADLSTARIRLPRWFLPKVDFVTEANSPPFLLELQAEILGLLPEGLSEMVAAGIAFKKKGRVREEEVSECCRPGLERT
jgi:hypothetical protein